MTTIKKCTEVVEAFYGAENIRMIDYVYGPWSRSKRNRPLRSMSDLKLNAVLEKYNRTGASRIIDVNSIKFIVDPVTRRVIMTDSLLKRYQIENPTPEEIVSKLQPVENLQRKYYLARLLSPFTSNAERVSFRYRRWTSKTFWEGWYRYSVINRIPFWWVRSHDQVIRTVKWWYGKYWMIEALRDGGCFKTSNKYNCEIVVFRSRGYKLKFGTVHDNKHDTMSFFRTDKTDLKRKNYYCAQLSWVRFIYELWRIRRLPLV